MASDSCVYSRCEYDADDDDDDDPCTRVLRILVVPVSMRVIIFMRYARNRRDDLPVRSNSERFAATWTAALLSLPLILIDFSRLLADLAPRTARVLRQDSLASRMLARESAIQLFGAPLKQIAAERHRAVPIRARLDSSKRIVQRRHGKYRIIDERIVTFAGSACFRNFAKLSEITCNGRLTSSKNLVSYAHSYVCVLSLLGHYARCERSWLDSSTYDTERRDTSCVLSLSLFLGGFHRAQLHLVTQLRR